jgi:hypothetical protein
LDFAFSGATEEQIAVELQSLEHSMQEAQIRYDDIMQIEDARLKQNAKQVREREAKKLGTAKSIQQEATVVMNELKSAHVALALTGTVNHLLTIATIALLCVSGGDLTAVQLQIDAAQADLDAKSNITANHKAAENTARAQQNLYTARDLVKKLKMHLKSNVLTGNATLAWYAKEQTFISLTDIERQQLEEHLDTASRDCDVTRLEVHECQNISRRLNNLPLLRKPKFNRKQHGRDQDRIPSSGASAGGDAWSAPDLLSAEEIARMADPASGLAPYPTAERVAAITARASFLYNKDVVKVCAVCDHQRFTTSPLPWRPARHKTMLVTALPGSAQHWLVATETMELHDDLREQYNVSKLVPVEMRQYVSELLLSPRGMGQDGNITVCTECDSSLHSGNMPKFAIANG